MVDQLEVREVAITIQKDDNSKYSYANQSRLVLVSDEDGF